MAGPSWWTVGVTLPPQWAWKAEHGSKVDYPWALTLNEICPIRFWTYLGPVTPFFFFPFLLFGMKMLSYGSPMIVFGKHITYLVSEVHSLRGICFKVNCTLSHIYIRFRWCVDEISDCKVDARMSKDFRGYWDGMNVYCMWRQEFGRPGVECNRLNIDIPQGSYVEAWSPV